MNPSALTSIPKSYGCFPTAAPPVAGAIKQSPADFVVEELMDFAFSGSGEHVVLKIRKQGLSTYDVVDIMHREIGASSRDIGFCGLKDKHAVTTQWFSVRCPDQSDRAWSILENEQLKILTVGRHYRKLKRGSHRGNRFRIFIRQLAGNCKELELRLQDIKIRGAPNYFGPQRFGHSNLERAGALFRGEKRVSRKERSLLLSSARSRIFNDVLSLRVSNGIWDTLQPGDVANLNRTNSYFQVKAVTAELKVRLEQFDIHPSGPLFGQGENPAAQRVQELESKVFAQHRDWCAGLKTFGLKMQRRPLRMMTADMRWEIQPDAVLYLCFTLHKGGFATSVLNEFLENRSA